MSQDKRHTHILKEITLAINNQCNLGCNICYIKKRNGTIMSVDTICEIFQEIDSIPTIERVVVVAMEPFLNQASVDVLRRVARECSHRNIPCSCITNGQKLADYFDEELGRLLANTMISMDGGLQTYEKQRRGGSFGQLLSSIEHIRSCGVKSIDILHNLSKENCTDFHVTDMVEASFIVGRIVSVKRVWFTSFLSRINGENKAQIIPILDIARALMENKAFMTMDPLQGKFVLEYYAGLQDPQAVDLIRRSFPSELCEGNNRRAHLTSALPKKP